MTSVSRKGATILLPITWPDADRFVSLYYYYLPALSLGGEILTMSPALDYYTDDIAVRCV